MKQGRLVLSVLLTCLVCFGVLGATLAAGWRPVLGLDLAGGLSVVYTPQNGTASQSDLQTAANIMAARARAFGLSEPVIDVQGNTISVQIPGVTNRSQALNVIGSTAQLYFRQVLCVAPAYSPPTPAKGKPAPPPKYIPQDPSFTCPAANLISSADFNGSTSSPAVNEPAAGPWSALAQYQSNTPVQDQLKNGKYPVLLSSCPAASGCLQPRLLLGPALADGSIVKSATPEISGTQWVVSVGLTGSGTTIFDSIANKLYHNLLATDLGGEIQSTPVLLAQSFDTGVQISGGFTQNDANNLAQILQYGTLPVPLKVLDQSFVSATLGRSSLTAGLAAGLLGLVLVMLYMVFYYRALGLVVILGLVTTGALIYGLISLFGHSENLTLDLSGVTGLVVSVGITVDSYVVYFERLKDEIRSGRSVRASVDRGFRRAFRTVLAADAVSFLGAACLYILSIGAVKGFAYWLGVSTLIDVATAYLFTRPAVILLGRSRIVTDAPVIGIARGLAAATEATS